VGDCEKGKEFSGSIKKIGNIMTSSGGATILGPRQLHCRGLKIILRDPHTHTHTHTHSLVRAPTDEESAELQTSSLQNTTLRENLDRLKNF